MSVDPVAAPAPHADPEQGATLLEMLVVVALMGLISSLVAASFKPALRRASLAASAAQVRQSLVLARAAAMRTGRDAAFEAAEDRMGYSAAGRTYALPRGVRVSAEPEAVVFGPDGDSRGGSVSLDDGRARISLGVAHDGEVMRTGGSRAR